LLLEVDDITLCVSFVYCECCQGQFERFGGAGATCRKRLKQRGYVFCSKGGYKHGGFKNKTEYMSWGAMKDRCNNPSSTAYIRMAGVVLNTIRPGLILKSF
jgi:hypothetical protein